MGKCSVRKSSGDEASSPRVAVRFCSETAFILIEEPFNQRPGRESVGDFIGRIERNRDGSTIARGFDAGWHVISAWQHLGLDCLGHIEWLWSGSRSPVAAVYPIGKRKIPHIVEHRARTEPGTQVKMPSDRSDV